MRLSPSLFHGLVSLALLLDSPVSAIYRDEAYQIDYQHALLGTPVLENTFFYQPSFASKANLLYTISDKHVLGAVNPRDGSLIWRQNLAQDQDTSAATRSFLGATNGTATVVSAYGNTVRAWEAATGRLHWQFDGMGIAQSLVAPDITGASQDPIVLLDDGGLARILRLNIITGKVVWEVSEDIGEIPLAVTASASHAYYVSLQSALLKGYKIKVTTVDVTKAAPVEHNLISSEGEISSKESVLFVGTATSCPVIVWADKTFKSVKINVLGTKNVVSLSTKSKDPITQVSVHASASNTAPSHFLVHYQTATGHWAEVYHVDGKSKAVKKAYNLPEVKGQGAYSAVALGASVFFTRTTESELSLLRSTSDKVLDQWPLSRVRQMDPSRPIEIAQAVAEVAVKADSSFAVRLAMVHSSGDWELVRNGESEWARDESLAGAVAAAWVEMPAAEDLARELEVESHNNVLTAYVHRVRRHIRDLQYLPAWLQGIPKRIFASFVGGTASTEQQVLESNAFGFRKIVVVATQKGRLIALDTGLQGRVIWNIEAAEVAPGTQWNVTGIYAEDSTVLVTTDGAEYLVVEAMTGALLKHKIDGAHAKLQNLVPVPNAIGKSALIPISEDGIPRNIPATTLGDNTFIVTRRSDRELAGWKIVHGTTPAAAWTFSPSDGEVIKGITTRAALDPVASIGKALGDRNVLYKYLSSNVMLVTATNEAKSTVALYLVNTISGDTLYSTTHRGVDTAKPVSAVFSENWFAYTYYSDPSLVSTSPSEHPPPKSYILTVSELFESSVPNDRGPLGDAGNYSSVSGPMYSPYVASASYVVPAPLSHLTPTASTQGITPRSLLAYCAPLAAIVAIPVPFLNPKRPVGREPTANEREEGLFRYNPLLDLNPQWTLSHGRQVLGVAGMIVSPTHMESTSLVFAYGELDVFGTRIAPIGAFDMLGKGFGKIQLLLTVVALAAGTGILAPMVRKKQIDGLWTAN